MGTFQIWNRTGKCMGKSIRNVNMGSSNDKEAVKEQYASSKGLDTRINSI